VLSTSMDLMGMSLPKDFLGRALDNTSSDWQARRLLEVKVDLTSSLAAFINAPASLLDCMSIANMAKDNLPHNERLATTAITSSKNSFHACMVSARRSLNILASIFLNLVTEYTVFGAQETH
jgi:hypothetical protein